MNNENNNLETQSNITDIPANETSIDNTQYDAPIDNNQYDAPIDNNQYDDQAYETSTDEANYDYDMPNGDFFEDSQSNINKSINNPTAVVDQYNQVSNGYIDDSEGISSYEDQIQNSQDISLYTQQSKTTDSPENYDDEYVFNEDMNNYNNQYYDDAYNDEYGYDQYYDDGMYDNNTVAYNNSGYSSYGNDFNTLNSGGYNTNGNFTVAPSYAPPTNNMVNFNQQPIQQIPSVQTIPVQIVATPQVVTALGVQPTAGELISDGTNHPKTIGPEEFERKVRRSKRPFNFMLLIVYAIIIAIIGYFGYNLWQEKNAYTLSKDRMNLISGYSYTEVVYEKGKMDLNTNYTWKSENETIATVDDSGRITAKSVGSTYIVVKSKKTKKVRKVMVEVVDLQIKSLEITPKEKILYVGNDAFTIIPSINGSSKYTVNLNWKSSNENVATVSSDGVVTTKTKGTTVITVTIPNTKFKATMTIVVREKGSIK